LRPSSANCRASERSSLSSSAAAVTIDLGAYDAYLQGKLQGFEYPEAKPREAQAGLPKIK
jgi:hypothetical protein